MMSGRDDSSGLGQRVGERSGKPGMGLYLGCLAIRSLHVRVERVRGNIATIVRIKKVAFVKVGLQNCCNLTT